MLFFVGNESSDPLFPLSSTSTAATSANQTRSNSVSVPNFTLSKEDSFSHPETTISASNLPGMVAASVSAVGKNDVKYVDVEATKKFARLLRKDEKVKKIQNRYFSVVWRIFLIYYVLIV